MKKTLLLTILLSVSFCASAQLKVFNNGNVNIGSTYSYVPAVLSVGVNDSSAISSLDLNYIGLYAKSPLSPVSVPIIRDNTSNPLIPTFWVSVMGDANDLANATHSYNQAAIGVMGKAGNTLPGYNYGVFGTIMGTTNGAGVFASINENYTCVSGRYAGYFKGSTYVDGTLTATSVVTPSDMRLKTKVKSLNNEKYILDNLLKMDVISYNYKTEIEESHTVNRHYGFSAQELQKVFPDLVYEGQDGYLGVNYVEMVPVLLRAIQELKEEIDELKGTGTARKSPTVSTTSVDNAKGNNNMLYQNTPNPAKNQTIIRYQLAEDAQDAAICIFDMTGKQVKKFPISSGTNNVVINGYELGQGMFLYSLIVNGQEIDTKKMIISK